MRRFLPKINGGEALIYVLIIIAIAMMLTMLISAKTPKLKQDKKKYFYYILFQSLGFILFSVIIYNLKDVTISKRFISYQIYFALVGAAHLVLFQTYFKKFDSKKMFTEVAIAFVTSLFIAGFMSIIAGVFDDLDYLTYLMATLLFFSIPTLTYVLFETAVSIPAKRRYGF